MIKIVDVKERGGTFLYDSPQRLISPSNTSITNLNVNQNVFANDTIQWLKVFGRLFCAFVSCHSLLKVTVPWKWKGRHFMAETKILLIISNWIAKKDSANDSAYQEPFYPSFNLILFAYNTHFPSAPVSFDSMIYSKSLNVFICRSLVKLKRNYHYANVVGKKNIFARFQC